MSTFERDTAIVTLAERASAQAREGLTSLHAGRPLEAQVFLSAALAMMQSLIVLLDSHESPRPLRKLCLVVAQEEALPEWFARKANSEDPDAA